MARRRRSEVSNEANNAESKAIDETNNKNGTDAANNIGNKETNNVS